MKDKGSNFVKQDVEQFISLFPHQSGGQTLNSISLLGKENQDAYLKLIRGGLQQITLGLVYETGSLVLRNENQQLFEINNDQILIKAKKIRMRSLKIKGIYNYQNIAQWRQHTGEYFSEQPFGWTNNTVSKCGAIWMLGGYGKFSGGQTKKTFDKLVKHSMLKIQANFHFIDGWKGQMGYLQLDTGQDRGYEYVWTEKYDTSDYDREMGVSICGRELPEFRFSTAIDITIDHSLDTLTVLFGSTLDNDPTDASWGISAFKIFIK